MTFKTWARKCQTGFDGVFFFILKNQVVHQIWLGYAAAKNPDEKLQEEKRKENLNAEGWTSSLEEIPEVNHSVVEEFFQNSEEKRHLTDGYAFSKTNKFETSGKPP